MVGSQQQLAKILSQLQVFANPKIHLEQYVTESNVAAMMLWHAQLQNELEGMTVADLGCGTGILGIGALLLGAKKVYFVDVDPEALTILKVNLDQVKELHEGTFQIFHQEIGEFNKTVDLVVQNPPFGTRSKHADKMFLQKALQIAPMVYSLHKTSTLPYLESWLQQVGHAVVDKIALNYQLKKTLAMHKKKVQVIDVVCLKIAR